MINNVIDATIDAIIEEFGETTIYTDDMEQGMKEPCFYITSIANSHYEQLQGRYKREVNVRVLYFPKPKAVEECNDVAERLLYCLEIIKDADSLIRGMNMSYRIVDQVLNFFVDYSFILTRLENKQKMETYKVKLELEVGD